jgi:hypothetical protein
MNPPASSFVRTRVDQMMQRAQAQASPSAQPAPDARPPQQQPQQQSPPAARKKSKWTMLNTMWTSFAVRWPRAARQGFRRSGMPSAPEGYEVKNSPAVQLPADFKIDMTKSRDRGRAPIRDR